MKEFKVLDAFNITQVSKSNNEVWIELMRIADEYGEDILFDFNGITLQEPFNNTYFMKLMGNNAVYLKLYCAERTKNTIELACQFGALKTGRVFNEDYLDDDWEEEEKDNLLDMLVSRIMRYTTIRGDEVVINIGDTFDKITESKTVEAINYIVNNVVTTKGIKRFELNIENVVVGDNILMLIANSIFKYRDSGVDIELVSNDNIMSKLYLYRGDMVTDIEDKIKLLESNMSYNTIGIISRFKRTKVKDRFGRCGEGKPIIVRVAIFKGIDNGVVKLLTFNKKYFYTKQEYLLENDGAILNELVTNEWKIPIEQMGFCDKFVGSLYHLNLPIQYLKDDYITYNKPIKDLKSGEVVFRTEKKTLPEHIKMVLDDFDIKYNAIALADAVRQTRKHLGE